MHDLFLVYFVNLYMFQAYLGPSSGGTTLCTVYKQNINFTQKKLTQFNWSVFQNVNLSLQALTGNPCFETR